MCKVPGLDFIPSPLEVVRSVGVLVDVTASNWRPVAMVAGGGVVVAFTLTHVLIVGAAVAVFLGGMGAVVWRMRVPERMPQATVTTRRGQGVRAITAGQRAIEAPRVVLPGQVLETAERVAR